MGVIDCLCVSLCFAFVLTFFMIWTTGVRDRYSVALNCSIEQTQKLPNSPVALQLRAPPQSKRKSPCAQVISL